MQTELGASVISWARLQTQLSDSAWRWWMVDVWLSLLVAFRFKIITFIQNIDTQQQEVFVFVFLVRKINPPATYFGKWTGWSLEKLMIFQTHFDFSLVCGVLLQKSNMFCDYIIDDEMRNCSVIICIFHSPLKACAARFHCASWDDQHRVWMFGHFPKTWKWLPIRTSYWCAAVWDQRALHLR